MLMSDLHFIGRPDIPSLKKFLLAQCERFEDICFVLGNPCFYQGEYEDRLFILHIHFLQNKTYLLNKVRILGTAFWTYVPPEKADEYKFISKCEYDRYSNTN